MAHATLPASAETADAFPIMGTDFIEFYVGNARQASHYYRSAFGYRLTGYAGPETGVRDRASYLLEQGRIPADQIEAALLALGLSLQIRAEAVSLEQFAELTRRLHA